MDIWIWVLSFASAAFGTCIAHDKPKWAVVALFVVVIALHCSWVPLYPFTQVP